VRQPPTHSAAARPDAASQRQPRPARPIARRPLIAAHLLDISYSVATGHSRFLPRGATFGETPIGVKQHSYRSVTMDDCGQGANCPDMSAPPGAAIRGSGAIGWTSKTCPCPSIDRMVILWGGLDGLAMCGHLGSAEPREGRAAHGPSIGKGRARPHGRGRRARCYSVSACGCAATAKQHSGGERDDRSSRDHDHAARWFS